MPAAEAIPASSCPLQHRHGHRGAYRAANGRRVQTRLEEHAPAWAPGAVPAPDRRRSARAPHRSPHAARCHRAAHLGRARATRCAPRLPEAGAVV